jgi:cell division protease FtsH
MKNFHANHPNPDNKSKPKRNIRDLAPLLWLLFLTLLLVAPLLFDKSPSERPAQLTYSEFVQQVKKGNVTSVEMSGLRVGGSLKNPISWTLVGATQPSEHKTFVTNLPEADDPSLFPLLERQGVSVVAHQSGLSWLIIILVGTLITLLLVGIFYFVGSKRRGNHVGSNNFTQSKARLYTLNQPSTSFSDVAGEDQAKLELAEIVDFLKNPLKYHRLGGRIPKGVLLVGPPGTGKTLLARAVAGEAGAPFFSISASEFVEIYVGVGASRVRDLFSKAKEQAPSIIFVDELDAVGRQRGASFGNDEREQTLNQILVEMDGFDPYNQIIVIAATNRPDVLDPALLRPGRFDRQVVVGLPDRRGREDILKIHTRNMPLDSNVDLGIVARETPGFSGADLANLCNEAALMAARYERQKVGVPEFQEALDKILLGAEKASRMDEDELRTVAYHEAGHALVASLIPGADPVHRVTIIPRGRALGVTAQLPEVERYNHSRDELVTKLTVLMGGRAAEEIALGQITTGAESDFQQATRLALGMVTRWGMSEELGPVGYHANETNPSSFRELGLDRAYSEMTAGLIDQEVKNILRETHQRAIKILTEHKEQLEHLAHALLKEETLDAVGVKSILLQSI